MKGQPRIDMQEFIIETLGIVADATASDDRTQAAPIFVGARIKMTTLGARRNPYFADRKGTVVGGSRASSSFRVLFDGRKTPISMHRDYLELCAV